MQRGQVVAFELLELWADYAHSNDVLGCKLVMAMDIACHCKAQTPNLSTYLVDFHHDQQIIIRQINLMARSDCRSYGLDELVPREFLIVPYRRTNCELFSEAGVSIWLFQPCNHAWLRRQLVAD